MKSQEKDYFLSLYCHVPFCPHHCDYCAFYQEAPLRQSIQNFLSGISHEIELTKFNDLPKTVFWGGGLLGF